MNEYSSQRDSAQIKEASNSSTLDTIKGFFLNSFSCFSEPNNQGCIQKMFLILSLVGTLLSVIGAIFSLIHRFCACFFCCRRSPRPGSTNQVNNNNKQLELMQMQMQQQQMCNALIGAALAKRGSAKNGNKKGGNNKKNKKSSNRTKKPRNGNSNNKHHHIGYHKN
ncbi:hypothetical protein POVCU2_0055720 [Plasmodium ovale curtisi]|uniref:PIR Superfamily Protein n=2 Tax=Plasmodium ovale curtisi TaxID=864141 RepID=A0A1A8W9Q1_PLAOA|nr:hypothetical protein POVCU2_0055720 [Plasmodium ovale curtisi]